MSDELAKFDVAFEQAALKISDILRNLLRNTPNTKDDLDSQLIVDESMLSHRISRCISQQRFSKYPAVIFNNNRNYLQKALRNTSRLSNGTL